jgi:hypothetical protein
MATALLAILNNARNKARVRVSEVDLKQVEKAVVAYYQDTGVLPSTCNRTCTVATDPFINSLGVPRWSGPYVRLWDAFHPWKGHINFYNDTHGPIVSLDDDAAGGISEDNTGAIPSAYILQIDQDLDDGNINTGRIRINLTPECNATGELCYLITLQ